MYASASVHVVTPPPVTEDGVPVAESTLTAMMRIFPSAAAATLGVASEAVTVVLAAAIQLPTEEMVAGPETVVYVKWSAALVVLVPLGVVMVTSTVPGACAGAVVVICVALFTVSVVADVVPNFTAVAPVKLEPVMVTVVPPVCGPDVGAIPVTTGSVETMNVN